MNPNYPQGGVTPNENETYPLARLNGSAYAAPLNFNNPSEVLSGYDAKVNPMTGEEIPDANFARGGRVGSDAGIARLLESRGRRGDTMLVHMAPEEVRGLQALALAHGGSLTINPQTGLYEASFLKKLLPTIAGAALNTFFPTAGKAVGSLFGLKDAAAANVGTGLIVGGITGLVEGDLKKGLMAGLGAYSGATLSSGLMSAQEAAEKAKVGNLVQPSTLAQQLGLKESEIMSPISSMKESIEKAVPGGLGVDVIDTTTAPLPAVGVAPAAPFVEIKPSLTGGIRSLFTQEGREAFGKALGGGFESPFAQNLSRYATFAGAMLPFTEQPKPFPTGGLNEDIVYIHGGRNPQYGTGRDQPYYLPGQYYKRTDRGLVPYNPFQLAPGYGQPPAVPQRGFGPRGRGFAEGGVVGEEVGMLGPFYGDTGIVQGSPGFVPAFATTSASTAAANPFEDPINISAYAEPTNDPNVLATRAYIEELNRRVRAPITLPSGGDTSGRGGLGSFGGAGLPITDGVGGGGVGGGGGGGAPGVGGIVGGLIAQNLINKGIGKGIDYLRDQFTTDPTIKRAQETPVTDDLQGVDLTTLPATQAALAALNPYNVPAPQFTVGVDEILDAQQPVELNADLQAKTQVGGDLSRPLSSYLSGASAAGSGLAALTSAAPGGGFVIYDALGNVIGGTASNVAAAAGAGGAAGTGAGAAGAGAGGAGATGQAGLGSLQTKIIPGLQTALGLYEAYKGIESGKEGRAALGGLSAGLGAGTLAGVKGLAALGPIGLGAAAIAALGASLVKTDEMGASSLRNYWRGVDEGRGIGQSNPQELAQGFINFYRTGKNNFPGLAKYGKKGNEDFVYDMTQVINNAVKSGAVSKDVDAPTMFREVVQPWLNTMGEGPSHPDARRVQDFMMTDLIHNFMQGAPISNAQVKGDKKFKTVSDRPVYAGIPPTLDRTIGGNAVPNDLAREMYAQNNVRQEDLDSWAMSNPIARMQALGQMPAPQSPFAVPEERATIMPVGESVPITPFDMGMLPQAPSEREMLGGEQPVYIPRDEGVGITPMPPAQFGPVEEYLGTPYMPEIPNAPEMGYNPFRFNMGGAVGEDFNFGFAQGGRPMEYRAGGKFLQGPGDGMSDDIKANIEGRQEARLADGEFVIPADVVSHLGNGSSNAGAKKLHQMMARVRQARTGRKKQAPAVKMDRYLPA